MLLLYNLVSYVPDLKLRSVGFEHNRGSCVACGGVFKSLNSNCFRGVVVISNILSEV